MPEAVVVGGFVKCPHGGTSKLQSGNDKLRVAGAAAVTAGMEAGVAFAPTTAPPTPATPTPCPIVNPVGTPSPCLPIQSASAGVSTKLTVGGAGVLLSTASGNTSNANDLSATTWSISSAGQSKLTVSG